MSKDPHQSRGRARQPGEASGAHASDGSAPADADGFVIASRGAARPSQSGPAGDHSALAPADLAAPPPTDPLVEFFYREDEPGSPLLEMGVPAVPRRGTNLAVDARREYLTFVLGGEEFGIDITHVREILKAPSITEVPRAAPHILGVITVRGEVIAVIDPRRRLNLQPPAPNASPRVIVCDAGEGPCGLLVDAVSQVVRLATASIEPRPSGIGDAETGYIMAIGRDGERLIVLLDAGLLLRRPTPSAEATT